MIPFAERLTLSTSSRCCSIDMFLWMIPIPPSFASAMARSLSVTVSMGELSSGMLIAIRLVSRGAHRDLGRDDVAIARFQQHVVEGNGRGQQLVVHGISSGRRVAKSFLGNRALWVRDAEIDNAPIDGRGPSARPLPGLSVRLATGDLPVG